MGKTLESQATSTMRVFDAEFDYWDAESKQQTDVLQRFLRSSPKNYGDFRDRRTFLASIWYSDLAFP